MKLTIRRKITLSYTLLFVILFGLLGVFLSRFFSQQYMDNLQVTLLSQANLLAGLSTELTDQDLDEYVQNVSANLGLRVTVIDPAGVPLAETDKPVGDLENHLARPEIQKALAGEAASASRYSTTLGSELLYAAVPIYDSGGEVIGVFRLAKSLVTINRTLMAIRTAVFGALLVGSLLSWLVANLLSGAITASLAALRQKARDIGRGYFPSQGDIEPGDEVTELDLVFNEMSANIQQMMAKLSWEQDRLESIIANLPVGVLVINGHGIVVAANEAARDILHTDLGGVNKPLTHLTRNYEVNEFAQKVLTTKESRQMELTLDKPGRDPQFIRINGAAVVKTVRESDEEIVVVLQDISDLRRLEQQRRELVANVSHELRTPMTAIQGFAETLMEPGVDLETSNRFLTIIRDESVRLARLVNDLLNLSRLESGWPRKEGVTELRAVAESVMNLLSEQAAKRNQQLTMSVRSEIVVAVDSDYVEQILMNYVGNAINYTPEGTIIKLVADVLDNGFVRLAVTDNGPGIEPEQQQQLFQRFFRVEKSRQRQGGGTGLGLAIVKHIVEGFGGQVGVISNFGVGTSFWATLPIKSD